MMMRFFIASFSCSVHSPGWYLIPRGKLEKVQGCFLYLPGVCPGSSYLTSNISALAATTQPSVYHTSNISALAAATQPSVYHTSNISALTATTQPSVYHTNNASAQTPKYQTSSILAQTLTYFTSSISAVAKTWQMSMMDTCFQANNRCFSFYEMRDADIKSLTSPAHLSQNNILVEVNLVEQSKLFKARLEADSNSSHQNFLAERKSCTSFSKLLCSAVAEHEHKATWNKLTKCINSGPFQCTSIQHLCRTHVLYSWQFMVFHICRRCYSIKRKDYNFPELKEGDVEENHVRGSGPGGQAVNQTANCVVLKHKPTGIVVKCHETRSLVENKKRAWQRLEEKLDLHLHGDQSYLRQLSSEIQRAKEEKKRRTRNRLVLKKSFKEKQLLKESEYEL